MLVLIKDVMKVIESEAPIHLAEKWDNVGLIIGDRETLVKKILVTLDVDESAIDKAIKENIDLIISHHPFIFNSLKKIDYRSVKGNLIYKLIKNDIAVYSAHTNLDFANNGLNSFLLKKLNVKSIQNLIDYKGEEIFKFIVYVPESHFEGLKEKLFEVGVGSTDKYSSCTFSSIGEGTFRPILGAQPFIGEIGKIEKVQEYKIETIVKKHLIKNVLDVIEEFHPYEEAAYDIYKLENKFDYYGYGKQGTLDFDVDIQELIVNIKKMLNVPYIKLIGDSKKKIRKIAVFTGAFDSNIIKKINSDSIDVIITGEIKHNVVLDLKAEGFTVIDVGHFGSEAIVKDLLKDILEKKFDNIEVFKNNLELEPYKYF